jgi:hypothetical protein
MTNVLTINTAMDEPRQIVLLIEGRKRILPFLSAEPKQITVNIPNPSIRKAQHLRQQYYAFVKAWVDKDEKTLAQISLDIVAEAFRSYRPLFTKRWIMRSLNNTTFTQVLDFILAPTREKEEEYLKNAITLQNAAKKQG